jgi:hypothetical protein
LTAGDLTLLREDDESIVPAGSIQVAYSANKATFTFTGGTLPNGNYKATIAPGDITDAAGNPLLNGSIFEFWFLAGDVNRDRSVSFADLVAVAQNYGKTAQTYDTGDVTGDGSVGFADLVMIAQNYGKTLPAPMAAAPLASEAAPGVSVADEGVSVPAETPAEVVSSGEELTQPPQNEPVLAALLAPPLPPVKRRTDDQNRSLFSSVPISPVRPNPPKPPPVIKQRR